MAKILVVEDLSTDMEVICRSLNQGGHQVIRAFNAEEGLEKALKQLPDAVVTDIAMPGPSGFELCRNLKTNDATKNVPIVICTSKNQTVDRMWAKKQGAQAYVVKPFEASLLLRAVQSVLG